MYNKEKLLDTHTMMKQLVRAVEAIPLHLALGIVKLDDALGESWALPYQACQIFTVICPYYRSQLWSHAYKRQEFSNTSYCHSLRK